MSGNRPETDQATESIRPRGGEVTAMTDSERSGNGKTTDDRSHLNLIEATVVVLFAIAGTAAFYFFIQDPTIILQFGSPLIP